MSAAIETIVDQAAQPKLDEPCFELRDGCLTRSIRVGSVMHRACIDLGACGVASAAVSSIGLAIPTGSAICEDLAGAWWKALLAGALPKPAFNLSDCYAPVSIAALNPSDFAPPLRTVDLFCGIGGLSQGIRVAAAELGHDVRCEFAVDTDVAALDVFRRNHQPVRISSESTRALLDYRVRGDGSGATFVYPPGLLDDSVAELCDGVDLMVAGPPCQGHSNLNNYSRRSDRRNHLYLSVVAFAVAVQARAVIIENVPAVVYDDSQVVASAIALLEAAGYVIETKVFAAHEMGWPQTRKRHFLVAYLEPGCSFDRQAEAPASSTLSDLHLLDEVANALRSTELRSVMWAIGGGQALSGDERLHELPELSRTNQERIAWLYDNDAHDLVLTERPQSHRNGTSYISSYGRMHADRPAPTITTGYNTPGRGRFIHPTEPRTISHAEAARLQGFPDTYIFESSTGCVVTSAQLSKWIGNAVAVPLGYAAALSVLWPVVCQSNLKLAT